MRLRGTVTVLRRWLYCALALGVALYASCGARYFLIDRDYERLVKSNPSDRKAVESVLANYSAREIADPQEMQRNLRTQTLEGRLYWRYTRLGLSIDVILEENQRVYAIWPDYE